MKWFEKFEKFQVEITAIATVVAIIVGLYLGLGK